MLAEFRDVIAKGNVMDMAVGIIVGAAFTGIVQSVVADLINPIIAFVVFMLVRYVNKTKSMAERPQDVAPEIPTGPSGLDVLIEIRDQLKRI